MLVNMKIVNFVVIDQLNLRSANLRRKMVKKTKPKKDYGYYCDLCGKKICKYQLDFQSCGGIYVGLPHKPTDKLEVEYVELCSECCKEIAQEVLDAF